MKFLRGKEKYIECKNHQIIPIGEELKSGKIIFGCLNCGVRFDSEEEIKKDITKRRFGFL